MRIEGYSPCSKGQPWRLERPLSRSSPRRASPSAPQARFSRAVRPQATPRRRRPRRRSPQASSSPKGSSTRRAHQRLRPRRPRSPHLRQPRRQRRNPALKVLVQCRRNGALRREFRPRLRRHNQLAPRLPIHVQSPRHRLWTPGWFNRGPSKRLRLNPYSPLLRRNRGSWILLWRKTLCWVCRWKPPSVAKRRASRMKSPHG